MKKGSNERKEYSDRASVDVVSDSTHDPLRQCRAVDQVSGLREGALVTRLMFITSTTPRV